MKNNKFYTSSALFFTTCTNTTVNFLLRRLEGVNTRTKSELVCGPQDTLGKVTNICHFKEINPTKFKVCKAIWRIVRTSEKILATPLKTMRLLQL